MPGSPAPLPTSMTVLPGSISCTQCGAVEDVPLPDSGRFLGAQQAVRDPSRRQNVDILTNSADLVPVQLAGQPARLRQERWSRRSWSGGMDDHVPLGFFTL